MNFSSRLLSWFQNNKRDLPWRASDDPYKIWLSEIILQQTRIAQGISYYYRFIDLFPDINTLARASEDQILAAWQGLGYYSRARNLHHTAQFIVEHYNGIFPKSYSQLLQLKGIGKYTAAAIASIAFNKPYAAVDGNAIRVLTRLFGIEEPYDDNAIRKKIDEIANQLIDQDKPGDYNQALMDFGSMICKPSSPSCSNCPFAQECIARLENKTEMIPVKGKKVKQKKRFFHFFLFLCPPNDSSAFFIEKRENNDIWKNLYQLPLIETNSGIFDLSLFKERKSDDLKNNRSRTDTESLGTNDSKNILIKILPEIIKHSLSPEISYEHQLTHQRIYANFYKVNLSEDYCSTFERYYRKTTHIEFEKLGKPILIAKFMDKLGNSSCI
jgi:A/G-specific adenine glycosylase